VQVHHGEGVAIHIGPESCAGGREAAREALTGERVGQPLNRETDAFWVPVRKRGIRSCSDAFPSLLVRSTDRPFAVGPLQAAYARA
jgi:hypothetical protein